MRHRLRFEWSAITSVVVLLIIGGCNAPALPGPSPTSSVIQQTPTTPLSVDHSLAGLPANKTEFVLPEGLPPDYLSFDEATYHVHAKSLHGTQLVFAAHRDLDARETIGPFEIADRAQVAAFLEATFDHHWHVFGGYPYTNATFVVRDTDDSCQWLTATAGGAPVCHASYANDAQPNGPPSPYTTTFYKEWFAHEMFHMWNGGVLRAPVSPEGHIFVSETWLVEGGASYYAARGVAHAGDQAGYDALMERSRAQYEKRAGGSGDMSFAELARRIGRGGPSGPNESAAADTEFLYAKGTLVAYLLDARLSDAGTSLDAAFTRLYQDEGLGGIPMSNARIQAAAQKVSGLDLESFFADHVHGTRRIEESTPYLERD